MKVFIGQHPQFSRDLKKLQKKYKSLSKDYAQLLADLEANPLLGTDLGDGVRKVRMAIAAKGKGKSGGARVITFNVALKNNEEYEVTLLTIYDKSEMSNISDAFIQYLLETLPRK